MELQELFEKAVTESKLLSKKPDNETLLRIYALYKQATEGNIKGEAPTNPFDFVNKAKYEAWLGLSDVSQQSAMEQYVTLINSLKEVN